MSNKGINWLRIAVILLGVGLLVQFHTNHQLTLRINELTPSKDEATEQFLRLRQEQEYQLRKIQIERDLKLAEMQASADIEEAKRKHNDVLHSAMYPSVFPKCPKVHINWHGNRIFSRDEGANEVPKLDCP